MAIQDLLNRLRPAGAPGPARPGAVPDEDEDPCAAELAPVFAMLAEAVAKTEAVRAAATDRTAAAKAGAERAAAATRVHTAGDEEAAKLLAEAKQQGARLRADSEQRLDELTDLVIANLRAHIAAADPEPMQVAR